MILTRNNRLIYQNGVAQSVEQRGTIIRRSAVQVRPPFLRQHLTNMKAIIQTVKKTYRTTTSVKLDGRLYETVNKIDARTKETTILGVPVLTQFSVDGEEKIVRFLGIPIKSFRQELWDHHS